MAFGVTRDPMTGAIRGNEAATGRKLYGAGRARGANQGQSLDRTGYQEREERKRARRREEARRFAMAAGGSGGRERPAGAAGATRTTIR